MVCNAAKHSSSRTRTDVTAGMTGILAVRKQFSRCKASTEETIWTDTHVDCIGGITLEGLVVQEIVGYTPKPHVRR